MDTGLQESNDIIISDPKMHAMVEKRSLLVLAIALLGFYFCVACPQKNAPLPASPSPTPAPPVPVKSPSPTPVAPVVRPSPPPEVHPTSPALPGPRPVSPVAPVARDIPKFPWPPPAASATYVLPLRSYLGEGPRTLKDADVLITKTLRTAGYVERSYYGVPEGFALVTRLEQINDNGTPKALPDRWSVEAPRLTTFSFSEYLSALFSAPHGYYRVIVFVITPVPFYQVDAQVTGAMAEAWLTHGLNGLPSSIAALPYTSDAACTALVYEFQRAQGQPSILVPGRLDGLTHLRKSGIASALGLP
jgi:hypothetical protein